MADLLNSKQAVHRFLSRLEAHLNSTIAAPADVRAKLAVAVAKARSVARRTADRHSTFAEGAFLNTYVLGGLHAFLMSELRLSPEHARLAVLSESYRAQSQCEYRGAPCSRLV